MNLITICSMSFGKDSIAMAEKMIELNYQVNEWIYYDVGGDFDVIYDNIKIFENNHNIKVKILKPKEDFLYKVAEKEVHKRNGTTVKGYGFCGYKGCKFGTHEKYTIMNSYLKNKYPNSIFIEYVGLASDEIPRIIRNRQSLEIDKDIKNIKLYPLAELNITEKEALAYCYEKGYNWKQYEPLTDTYIELYDILDRVSCWCCANKNLKELYNIYKFLPSYWNKLKDLQNKTRLPMKDYKIRDDDNKIISYGKIDELEKRFILQDKYNDFNLRNLEYKNEFIKLLKE